MTSLRRYLYGGRNRVRRWIKRWLLRYAPEITCERCGRPLFRAFPVIANGRLYLYGAEEITVHSEWSSKRTLRFRHDSLHLCRRGDEPLVRVTQLGTGSSGTET